MKVKSQLIIELLKKSQNNINISIKILAESMNLSINRIKELLEELRMEKLIEILQIQNETYCKPLNRIQLAYKAIQLGANIKHIALALTWREFEEICAQAFMVNEYEIHRNFRFKVWRKYYEIDVIGIKKPYVICVDCKRWSAGRFSIIHKHAEQHYSRIKELSRNRDALRRLRISSWNKIIFIPVILTVHEDKVSIYNGIPIVPVFKFNSFLNELPLGLDLIKKIEVKQS